MAGSTTYIERVRTVAKSVMRTIARILNNLTGGRIKPNTVTTVGLLAHIPIAFLIGARSFVLATILLIIFGLFDSLDGELARLQHRESRFGMLLDSTTDRIKEILIYIGVAFAVVADGRPGWAVVAVAALGFSMLVSYINAWGEAVTSRSGRGSSRVNQTYRGGFMSFDVRMTVIVLALLLNKVEPALIIITILVWWTAMNRLVTIMNQLEN